MKNELLTKGIILPSGEIGKNKINLVAGAITQPFAEMVWVTTGGDMETINRLNRLIFLLLLIAFYSPAWDLGTIWAPLAENAPPKQAIKETPRTRKSIVFMRVSGVF